ncbi:hypothetical protein V8F33_012789, partial [Rhypophila sp. PSN 637]
PAANNHVQPSGRRDYGFSPSSLAINGPGWQREMTEEERSLARQTDMSPNYKGDPAIFKHYSVPELPEEENCAFWLSRFPKDVRVNEITEAIRDCGRIWALHINREGIPEHGQAGAKLVFFTRRGAARFWSRYKVNGPFVVRGHWILVVRNRFKTPENMDTPAVRTRCIRVHGPPHLVNSDRLLAFFTGKLEWELDEIINHPSDDVFAVVDIRFAAYRGQAHLAVKALLSHERYTREVTFGVMYRPNPCDEVPEDDN